MLQYKTICRKHCNQWVHIKCNNLNDLDYNILKSKHENWYCILCTPEILPFCQINEKMYIPKENLNKPSDALVNLMKLLSWFIRLTNDEKENQLNLPNCNYRDTDYFKNLTKDFKRKALSFFHMNVCSLTKYFDDLNILLGDLNVSFDILSITETRIKKDSWSPINLQLNNYLIEHTPTESTAGGTLLYISKILSYQLRHHLRLSGKIESAFIEIICSASTNVIVGCIHKHPTLPINDFTNEFISPLLLKLQKESSKSVFLLGDFNIDVLKYEISDSVNSFIDTLNSNFSLPLIFLPISKTSTVIDNIFSNSTSLEEIVSGNATTTFLDHLPQFIYSPDFFSKITVPKSNILRSDRKKIESSKFISDFNQINWEQILCNEKMMSTFQ